MSQLLSRPGDDPSDVLRQSGDAAKSDGHRLPILSSRVPIYPFGFKSMEDWLDLGMSLSSLSSFLTQRKKLKQEL